VPIWYGLWGKGILPFLAIFFATAVCKAKLCSHNFHTKLTAASSGKGVLWQQFHDRSWVYRTVYRIYSISFVSLRWTDTGIMKFGGKRSVKTSRTWFGRRTKTDGKRKLNSLNKSYSLYKRRQRKTVMIRKKGIYT
jgi:hypothetical protein